MDGDTGGVAGGTGDRVGDGQEVGGHVGPEPAPDYSTLDKDRPVPPIREGAGLIRKGVIKLHIVYEDGEEQSWYFTNPDHIALYRRLDNNRGSDQGYVRGEGYHDHEVIWTTP